MALKKTVPAPFGFVAADAYHKVERITHVEKDSIDFHLNSYKSKGDSNYFGNRILRCAYDMDGVNPWKQAYAHVRTLDDFRDAADC